MTRDPLELLQRMVPLQTAAFSAFHEAESAKRAGSYDEAAAAYERFIDLGTQHLHLAHEFNRVAPSPTETSPIARPVVNALTTLADVRQAQGRRDRADQLREQALVLAREELGETGAIEVDRSRVASLIAEARFPEALVTLARVRDALERSGDALALARVTLDLADLLQWLGDHERALVEIERAEAAVRPLLPGRRPTHQDVLAAMFDALGAIAQGGTGRAAEDTAQLMRIATEIDFFRGLVCRAAGRWDDAERHFAAVLHDYEQLGSGDAIRYQLASIRLGQRRFADALTLADRLEPVFRANAAFRPKLAPLLRIRAAALTGLGRATEAADVIAEAVADHDRHYDPDVLWRLQQTQAEVFDAMGRAEKALDAYGSAIETVVSLRKAPLGHRLDSTYLADKIPLFERAIDRACAAGRARRCATFIERIKSRTLLASLSAPPTGPPPDDDAEQTRFDAVTLELDALEYSAYREGWSDVLRQDRAALLDERRDLLERIRFSDPRWRALTQAVTPDLDAVAQRLATRGHAALTLFLRAADIVSVLVHDGQWLAGRVALDDEVRGALEAYEHNLTLDEPDPEMFDLSAAKGIHADRLIPRELLTRALGAQAIVIAPHGVLHLVPWAGLRLDGQRLFESVAIAVVPNLACIPALDADPVAQPRIALFGPPDYADLPGMDPLQGAVREMQQLRERYGTRIARSVQGAAADEAAFADLARLADADDVILHIASHAEADPDEPMYGGFLFTGSRVDAAEIVRARPRFPEVVLSGCATGWRPRAVAGVQITGDEILGLPGAFLEAGARNVLVSIPRAFDNPSRRFMVQYHDERRAGHAPVEAFRRTQCSLLAEDVYPPFSWVGFTMYGCR